MNHYYTTVYPTHVSIKIPHVTKHTKIRSTHIVILDVDDHSRLPKHFGLYFELPHGGCHEGVKIVDRDRVDQKRIPLDRFLFNRNVRHLNGNTCDFRSKNIRLLPMKESLTRRSKWGRFKHKGVRRDHPTQTTWAAQVGRIVDGKLKSFVITPLPTQLEAARTHDLMSLVLGDRSINLGLNFPRSYSDYCDIIESHQLRTVEDVKRVVRACPRKTRRGVRRIGSGYGAKVELGGIDYNLGRYSFERTALRAVDQFRLQHDLMSPLNLPECKSEYLAAIAKSDLIVPWPDDLAFPQGQTIYAGVWPNTRGNGYYGGVKGGHGRPSYTKLCPDMIEARHERDRIVLRVRGPHVRLNHPNLREEYLKQIG